MPRSYQAYPQNAVVTHSPANVGTGDPSSAVNNGRNVFQIPSLLDACAGITNGTANPFIAGLNTMGDGSGGTTNTAGQTGNILAGFQQFLDALCGFSLGGTSASEVLHAARQLRAQGGNLHETIEAVRRLRDTVGAGTTPQSVLAGVEAVTGLVNDNPLAQSAISTGQAAVGVSGNQIIDAVNGSQTMADESHGLLTGLSSSGVSGTDLLNASGVALNQNTANHAGHTSLTTAQSVSLKAQNLLVVDDFSAASTVVGDTHWAWDGTDGSPNTNVLGCAKVTCNGSQRPLLSSEIPVVVGENIEVTAEVKWSGLTYTGGSPLVLSVQKYRLMKAAATGQYTYTDVGHHDVYTVPSPGASSSGWVGISGTYLVEAGVDQLRLRFNANPNASAGTVKWDAGSFLKLDLIADECVPGVGFTVDDIVTQLYGSTGSGFTHNASAVALANNANSLVSVTSRVAALEAEGHTGSIAGDDFAFTGEIVATANWGGFYSPASGSTYQANGVDAVWTPAFAFTFDTTYSYFDWQGTDSVSTTDYQLVQLILDSAPAAADVFGTDSYVYLYGRVASGWTSYVGGRIGSDGTWAIAYQAGSGLTTMTSGTCAVPGKGAIISLYLGDAPTAAPRHYRLEVGSTIVADFNEVGTGSLVGSSNRKYGWGGLAEAGFLSQAHPPNVNQWLGMDQ